MKLHISGLISAPFTPFAGDGGPDLPGIDRLCAHLVRQGVAGAFVCGTTGEGVAMTVAERMQVAERWLACAPQAFPVIVHAGALALGDARALAAHAERHRAAAVAVLAPCFLKPSGAAEVVEDLVRQRPAEWFADWDAVLATALGEAFDEARRTQGRNPQKWTWGRHNEFTLRHPVAGQVSWLAPYFNLGPVQLSGAGSTVKQTSASISPSQRMVADLSDWENSRMNLRAGQSAHRLSGHYKDQWEAYLAGRSFPAEFHRVGVKKTLRLLPR